MPTLLCRVELIVEPQTERPNIETLQFLSEPGSHRDLSQAEKTVSFLNQCLAQGEEQQLIILSIASQHLLLYK